MESGGVESVRGQEGRAEGMAVEGGWRNGGILQRPGSLNEYSVGANLHLH